MTHHTVAIVTDSTAYLPPDLISKYKIHVVPAIVTWGTQTYRDGVDIRSAEFFERLRTDPVQPMTSAPSIGACQEVYARAAQSAAGVVGIHISAKLSATYSAAEQARAMLPDLRIKVIDSNATAMAMGFAVLAAARAAAEGKSLEQVVQAAKETIACVGVVLTVETLEYLRRGGRIGGAQAFLGGLLDMKPVLELRDGRIEPVDRIRTKKKAVERVLVAVEEQVKGKSPIRLATIHAAAPQEAAALLEKANARLGAVEAIVAEASPAVAVHTGPGTIGLAYSAGS